jgi:hypothetical protein
MDSTREIQQQEGVSALFWSTSLGNSANSSPSKTPAEPLIPEGTKPVPLSLTLSYRNVLRMMLIPRYPGNGDFPGLSTGKSRHRPLPLPQSPRRHVPTISPTKTRLFHSRPRLPRQYKPSTYTSTSRDTRPAPALSPPSTTPHLDGVLKDTEWQSDPPTLALSDEFNALWTEYFREFVWGAWIRLEPCFAGAVFVQSR